MVYDRSHVPMVYYHVWDNYPAPVFNKSFYESNDLIASISKVTYNIVSDVTKNVENIYLPHAVNSKFFTQMSEDDISKMRKNHGIDDKFVVL